MTTTKKTYYTLAVKTDGIWGPEFGDYELEVVAQELEDMYYCYDGLKKAHCEILRTTDDQPAIDAAVALLNEKCEINDDPAWKVGQFYWMADATYRGRPWDIGADICPSREQAEQNAEDWHDTLTPNEKERAETWVRKYQITALDDEGNIGTAETVADDFPRGPKWTIYRTRPRNY